MFEHVCLQGFSYSRVHVHVFGFPGSSSTVSRLLWLYWEMVVDWNFIRRLPFFSKTYLFVGIQVQGNSYFKNLPWIQTHTGAYAFGSPLVLPPVTNTEEFFMKMSSTRSPRRRPKRKEKGPHPEPWHRSEARERYDKFRTHMETNDLQHILSPRSVLQSQVLSEQAVKLETSYLPDAFLFQALNREMLMEGFLQAPTYNKEYLTPGNVVSSCCNKGLWAQQLPSSSMYLQP